MSAPLLVEYFNALPEEALQGGPDVPVNRSAGEAEPGAGPRQCVLGGKARRRAAIHVFTQRARERYTEGALLRLLSIGDVVARRAAIFALGLYGSPKVNEALALALHDEDEDAAQLAADALWTLWFRGDSAANSDELYRVMRLRDRQEALRGLNALVEKAAGFAEARNQRALLNYRMEQYDRAAADCEAVLRLNPYHFGAQAGLGQCYLRMRKQRSALRAFRAALRINPRLEGIADMVRALENTLGDDASR